MRVAAIPYYRCACGATRTRNAVVPSTSPSSNMDGRPDVDRKKNPTGKFAASSREPVSSVSCVRCLRIMVSRVETTSSIVWGKATLYQNCVRMEATLNPFYNQNASFYPIFILNLDCRDGSYSAFPHALLVTLVA